MSRRRFGFSLAQLFLIVALAGLVFSLCRQLWLLRLERARRLSYSVHSVRFSPDGRLLAIGTDGLKLWDVASERIVFETVAESTPYVTCVTFSPDGKTLATAESHRSPGVKLWDVATRKVRRTFGGRPIQTIAISPDGRKLASGYVTRRMQIHDAESGETIDSYEPGGSGFRSLAFSPDGKVLAIAQGIGQTIRLWDVGSERLLGTLPGGDCVVFSPDGKTLAAPGPAISNEGGQTRFDGPEVVRIWETSSWTIRKTLEGTRAAIESVAFSPDGSTLACADRAGVVRLFDVKSGALTRVVELSKVVMGVKTSLAFSPDGKTLAVGLGEFHKGRVALVDLPSGRHRYIVWFQAPGIPWLLYGAGLVIWAALWWKVRRRRDVAVARDPLARARG